MHRRIEQLRRWEIFRIIRYKKKKFLLQPSSLSSSTTTFIILVFTPKIIAFWWFYYLSRFNTSVCKILLYLTIFRSIVKITWMSWRCVLMQNKPSVDFKVLHFPSYYFKADSHGLLLTHVAMADSCVSADIFLLFYTSAAAACSCESALKARSH